MQRAYKFRLIPTKQQEEYFLKAAGTARWAYNFYLAKKIEMYESGGKYSQLDARKDITELKNCNDKFKWLFEVNNNITKQAVKDCDRAFENFFRECKTTKKTGFPNFKSKRKSRPAFYAERIEFNKYNEVRIETIGWVKLGRDAKNFNIEHMNEKEIVKQNPRITFDGLYWSISFSINEDKLNDKEQVEADFIGEYIPDDTNEFSFLFGEEDKIDSNRHQSNVELTNEIIGIDLGVKELAILSDGTHYKNINKTEKLRKLQKKKKRLQRKYSRKLRMNNKEFYSLPNEKKKGKHPVETKNSIKVKKQISKIDRRIKNIRTDYKHQVSREIVNKHPKAIVMEDLNVKGMLKNKRLAKAIQEQGWSDFTNMIKYKAENQGTEFVKADRFYASSQICNNCKSKQKMPLKIRTYKCPNCGLAIDRDLNAAINLRNYYTA